MEANGGGTGVSKGGTVDPFSDSNHAFSHSETQSTAIDVGRQDGHEHRCNTFQLIFNY